MSRAPAYCDAIIAALSECGYPPTRVDDRDGGSAYWEPPPPWDVFDKARQICNGPDLDHPFSEPWTDDGVELVIRTNRGA